MSDDPGSLISDAAWAALIQAVRVEVPAAGERTLEYIRGLASYDDVAEDARNHLVMASYEVVLTGLAARRPPGAGDELPFETHGEARGRHGVVIADMLAAYRVGLDAMYRLAVLLAVLLNTWIG